MSHYRAALVFERWICAAVPIMPHYVNIAWGIIFWPCLFVHKVFIFNGVHELASLGCLQDRGGSLIPTKEWAMCRMCEGTKSMTKNKPAGHGCGGLSLLDGTGFR